MRKLYIHIGFHKTGSTSIQLSMMKNKDKMFSEGVEFVSSLDSGNSSNLVKVSQDKGYVKYTVVDNFFDLIENATSDKVIISAEHLSFIADLLTIEKIQSRLSKSFDQIKIIAFLRRQDKLAKSFKEQGAKTSAYKVQASSMLFGHSPDPFPEITPSVKEYFDYHSKLSKWSKVFGSENIDIVDFDKIRKLPNGIAGYFSRSLGLSFDLENIKVNVGASKEQTVMWHIFCQFGLNVHELKNLRNHVKSNGSSREVYIEDAISFYKSFEESNEKLSTLSSLEDNFFDEDFSHYSGEKIVDSIDINKLINILIKYKYEADFVQIIDLLRDVSFHLSHHHHNSKNIDYSLKLIDIANKLRPSGKLIKQHQHTLNIIKNNMDTHLDDLERVEYYMKSGWDNLKTSKFEFNSKKDFVFDEVIPFSNGLHENHSGNPYVSDLKNIMNGFSQDITIPVQCGDAMLEGSEPAFCKSRVIGNNKSFLLKLNTARHWNYNIVSEDVPWSNKKKDVVWRGATTGVFDRLKFVENYHDKYDVGFTKITPKVMSSASIMESCQNLIREPLSIKEQLNFKFIISLEGNDVATNLKWILSSNSVPVMKAPTKESWLMEGLLKPYIHYIPVSDDYSDLNEVIAWALDNDDKCKIIADNGKVFMQQFNNDERELYLQRMLILQYLNLSRVQK